jgi:dipeptidyl aminopeptidase/acylaminoacyl peptidase
MFMQKKKCAFIPALLMSISLALMVSSLQSQENTTTPFTLEDSLNLDALYFDQKLGLSSDRDIIAYTVEDGFYARAEKKPLSNLIRRGNHVRVHYLNTGKEIQLTRDAQYSWLPSVSPDGKLVAFNTWKDGRMRLGIWRADTGETEYLDPELFDGRKNLLWSPSMDRIYYFPSIYSGEGVIKPYNKGEKIIIRKSWEKDPYDERFENFRNSQVWYLSLKTRRFHPLISEEINIFSASLSPDGKNLAVLEVTRRKILSHLVPSDVRLDVYDTSGGGKKNVFVDKVHSTPYSWSSDSRMISFLDEGRINLYRLSDQKVTQMGTTESKLAGFPLWHPKKQEILCFQNGLPVVLDIQSDSQKQLKVDVPRPIQNVIWSSDGRSVFIQTRDKKTGDHALYSQTLKTGTLKKIFSGNRQISLLTPLKNAVLFTLQNMHTPENFWLHNLKSEKMVRITELNADAAQKSFGRAELVEWTSLAGDPLQGILLKPANYREGEKYPVIFWVYETFSSRVHRFLAPPYHLQVLANKGYAVFMPDVKFTIGETARSYKESIVPAIDKLVDMGISDGNFGLMGHSFGGFATNIIITQTTRFKAAVSVAGISDWASYHGVPGWVWRLGHEIGQGRIGDDLRKVPEKYIKNSPVFLLDRVTTPLLVIHGTADGGVPFNQAEEMYYGLHHLNKTSVLVGYPGEYHLYYGTERWVIKDIWDRSLSWFGKYLKGENETN